MPDDSGFLYGLPRMPAGYLPGPQGFKTAMHNIGKWTDPDNVDQSISDFDREEFFPKLKQYLPKAVGPIIDTKTCLYYKTSGDHHFRIGLHPSTPHVVVATNFSYHGFKFQPVMGEILADLAMTGKSTHQIDFIALERENF